VSQWLHAQASRAEPAGEKPRKQQWSEEACYHVMNRGHNHERIFAEDDDRRGFLDLHARSLDLGLSSDGTAVHRFAQTTPVQKAGSDYATSVPARIGQL
jgi:hypothetical protein